MAEAPTQDQIAQTLADRWLSFRNKLLASPRFQAFAAAVPGLRSIARSRARELFDLGAGFIYAQVYGAVIALGLLDHLAKAPRSSAEIASLVDFPEDNADRLARAAASVGLFERTSTGAWTLGSAGAAALGTPGLRDMIRHHNLLYRDLLDPIGFFRRQRGVGDLANYWAYAGAEDAAGAATSERANPYSALMAATQPMVAAQVLAAYPFGRHRHLLDIAGGAGAFAAAALARHPRLRATVFDLPAVATLAEARFAQDKLHDRATAVGGDLFSGALPVGPDVLTLIRVLHDHDDDRALAILRSARTACPPDGALVIAEPMAETPSARAMGDGYFGVYLFAMGQGRPRTRAEITDLARQAGFGRTQERPTRIPLIARVMVVRP